MNDSPFITLDLESKIDKLNITFDNIDINEPLE